MKKLVLMAVLLTIAGCKEPALLCLQDGTIAHRNEAGAISERIAENQTCTIQPDGSFIVKAK